MPIMDWGRQRSIYKVAELNKQLVQYTVDQEDANFEQAVLTQVNQYNTLKARIATTSEADAIAEEIGGLDRCAHAGGGLLRLTLSPAGQPWQADPDEAERRNDDPCL